MYCPKCNTETVFTDDGVLFECANCNTLFTKEMQNIDSEED